MRRGGSRWLVLAGLLLVAGIFGSPARAVERVVLFDQGHDQRFLLDSEEPLGLARLAGEFRAQELLPRALTREISAASLRGAAALVISGPFRAIGEGEVKAVTDFLQQGGRLCLLLHTAGPAMPLLRDLGVAVTKAPLREERNLLGDNPLEFRVINIEKHRLTEGVGSFNLNGAWGVINYTPAGRVLAWTSPEAWADLDGDGVRGAEEPPTALGVLVTGDMGRGGFVVIGDDAVFQNQFLVGGNLRLARNLAAWLKGGR